MPTTTSSLAVQWASRRLAWRALLGGTAAEEARELLKRTPHGRRGEKAEKERSCGGFYCQHRLLEVLRATKAESSRQ